MPQLIPRPWEELAPKMELILLQPTLTGAETLTGCRLAEQAGVAVVVVKPCFVRQAVHVLRGSQTTVGTVISYPYGCQATSIKVQETKRALTEGALVLSLPLNLGYVREGLFDLAVADLKAVVGLAHMNGARVTVMVDFGLLTGAEWGMACQMAVQAGVDGLSPVPGPGRVDLAEVRRAVGPDVLVKTSGPFPSLEAIEALMGLGADRVMIYLGDLERLNS